MRNLALKAYTWAQAHKNREEGQGTVEYALIIGAVVVVLVAVLATAATGWIGQVTTEVGTLF